MKKFLSVIVSISLVWTSGHVAEAAQAGVDALASTSNLPQFHLLPPSGLGRIVDYFNSSDGATEKATEPAKKLVILIQDLHANYGVQKNIAALLDFLTSKLSSTDSSHLSIAPSTFPPFALAVEGAAGNVDSSPIAMVPDEKVRAAASDYLMRQGELTGAEYFAIHRGLSHLLVGAENE